MADADELIIKIGADFQELKNQLKKAGGKVDNFGDDTKKVGKEIDKITKKMGAGFKTVASSVKAATVGITALGVAVSAVSKLTLDSADAQNLWARRLKVNQEEFSKLVSVGHRFGATVDDVGDSIKDLNERIADAASGNKTYEEAFERMGLASKNLINLPVEEQFLKVADAISKMTNVGNKNFVVADLMADAGFRLLPMLDKGAKGIKEMADEMTRMGATMSSSEIKKFEELNKKLREGELALKAAGKELTLAFAPAIEWLATDGVKHLKEFTKWYGNFTEIVSGKIGGGKPVIEAVIGGIIDSTDSIEDRIKVLEKEKSALDQNRKKWLDAIKTQEELDKLGAASRWNKSRNDAVRMNALFRAELNKSTHVVTEYHKQLAKLNLKLDAKKKIEAQILADKKKARELEESKKPIVEPFPPMTPDAKKQMLADAEAKKAALKAKKDLDRDYGKWLVNHQKTVSDELKALNFEARRFEEESDLVMQELKKTRKAKEAQEELEAEMRKMAIEKGIINEYQDFKKAADDAEIQAEKQKQFALQRLWEQGAMGKIKASKGMFSSLSSLMQTENRKLFEIGKAAAIANALVSSGEATVDAFKWGTKMGGYPVGIAMGAAAAVEGAVRIQQIASTTMGGGGGGGGAVSGGGGSASATESGGAQPQENINQTNFDITLQGDSYSGEQVRSLIGAINDEVDDGARIGSVRVK